MLVIADDAKVQFKLVAADMEIPVINLNQSTRSSAAVKRVVAQTDRGFRKRRDMDSGNHFVQLQLGLHPGSHLLAANAVDTRARPKVVGHLVEHGPAVAPFLGVSAVDSEWNGRPVRGGAQVDAVGAQRESFG